MQAFTKNIDRGFWHDAATAKMGHVEWFARKAEEAGIGPDDAELQKREASLIAEFQVGPNQTQRQKAVKRFAFDSYAVDKAFEELGIKLDGPDTMEFEKAFQVTSAQVLFPVFYDSRIVAGILAMPLLDALVAETVNINSGTADHFVLNETAAQRSTGEAGEFTSYNEMTISGVNAPIKLKKWAGILKMSDESIRRARLNIVSKFLMRMGQQIAIDLTDFAMDVMLLGDGNAGAPTAVASAVANNPTYADFVSLLFNFGIGYVPTDIVMPTNVIIKLLNIPEFKDPLAGFKFQNQGVMPQPFGITPHRWDSTGSSGWSALNKVLIFQRDIALVMYTEGGVRSESDRIINGQWAETATSLYAGFAILDAAARRQGTTYA